MQFMVMGYDGKDAEAPQRRLTHRQAHLDMVGKMVDSGNDLYACAMLDENDNMIGSMIITEFPSRKELDDWLSIEPYVLGNVWQTIEVIPCSVPPIFKK